MATVNTNYVLKSNNSVDFTNTAQSVIYDDGTNIGIGITNPGTKLVVNGAIRGGSFPNSTTNSGEAWVGRASDRTLGTYTIQLGGSSATGTSWEIVDRAWTKVIAAISGEAPASSFMVTNTGVVFMNGGSVGIGTTNPTSPGSNVKLHVKGTSSTNENDTTAFIQHSFSGDRGFALCVSRNGSVDTAAISLGSDSSNNAIVASNNTALIFGKNTAAVFSEYMRINTSGNVGIGTTNPGYPFDVRKATNNDVQTLAFFKNTGTTGTSYQSRIIIEGIDANTGLTIGRTATTTAHFSGVAGNFIDTYTTSDPLFLATGGTVRMYIASGSGNIGIGTTSPIAKLQVNYSVRVDDGLGGAGSDTYTASSNVYIGSTTGGGALQYNASRGLDLWQFNTSGTWARTTTFTRDGNVGMGTTNPSYKLHVNGTMYSAGSSVIYKENIKSYDTTTDKIMRLNPVTYDYKQEYTHLGKTLQSNYQIGLIAEEVAEVFPELAVLTEEEGQQVVRNVDYEKLSVILLTEVQKLRKELNQLKNH